MPAHLSPVTNVFVPHCSNSCKNAARDEDGVRQYDDMVDAFPADRTDQPFGVSVLPWRTRRRRPIANAHRSQSSDEDLTIGPTPIADQISGSLFPATSLHDLVSDPFCGRMRDDAKPQNLPSALPHNQQTVKQAKRNCRNDEHIHRDDAVGMIVKERLPALRWWASSPGHVLGHAGLSDVDAELEELPMDSRCSPQRVGDAHLADQPAYFQRYLGHYEIATSNASTI